MKTVNLLPSWYLKQRRRQQNLRLHIVAMVVLAGALFGASILGRQRLAVMNGQRDQLAARLREVGDPDVELRRLKSDLRRLQELGLARQELGPTVPMSAVIQQLQNDMTPGMALSNVNLDVRSDPVKGSGVVGDAHNPPRYHNVARISVLGVAQKEEKITTLVQDISKNPLFTDVTLQYIRTGTQQGYSVRRFEIQLSMDLERLLSEPKEVTADATKVSAATPLASGDSTHGQ